MICFKDCLETMWRIDREKVKEGKIGSRETSQEITAIVQVWQSSLDWTGSTGSADTLSDLGYILKIELIRLNEKDVGWERKKGADVPRILA